MPITWEYIGHWKCNPWHSSIFLSGCLIRNRTTAALFWLKGTTAELCGQEEASEVAQNLTLGRVWNTGLGLCRAVSSQMSSTPSPLACAVSWLWARAFLHPRQGNCLGSCPVWDPKSKGTVCQLEHLFLSAAMSSFSCIRTKSGNATSSTLKEHPV